MDIEQLVNQWSIPIGCLFFGSRLVVGVAEATGLIKAYWDFTASPSVKQHVGTVSTIGGIPQNGTKYALLISGELPDHTKNQERNTLTLVVDALQSRGYTSNNITLLYGDDQEPCPLAVGTHFPSCKESLEEALDVLAQKITPEDSLFLYVLTYGTRRFLNHVAGASNLILHSEEKIYPDELKTMLSGLNPAYTVMFFNQCYSGQFAKQLGGGKTIAIATSLPNKLTHDIPAEHQTRYGDYSSLFTLQFFSALRGKQQDGSAIELADPSLEGIFDYAAQMQFDVIGRNTRGIMKEPLVTKNTPMMVYGEINPRNLAL